MTAPSPVTEPRHRALGWWPLLIASKSSPHLFVSVGEEMIESLDPNEAEARIF
jgi:hypothetical protein